MRAVDFEAILARIAGAGDDDGLALVVFCHFKCLGCIESQLLAGQSQHLLHDSFCFRSLHSKLAVVVALMVEDDIEAFLLLKHPGHILIDIGGIDDEEEVILSHLIDQQVIDRSAVGIEHHSVVDLSEGGVGHIVGEDVLHVAFCIRARDAHFAHVTDIEDATVLTYCVVFIGNVSVLNRHNESAEG